MNDTHAPTQLDILNDQPELVSAPGIGSQTEQAPSAAEGETHSLEEITPKPARRKAIVAGAKVSSVRPDNKTDPAASAILVPASRITFHPDLGIDANEFAAVYAEGIEQIVDQVRRGLVPAVRPDVIALADGRLGAFNQLEMVAAYIRLAARSPALEVAVILLGAVDAASLVVEQLSVARGRSGWEQYAALKPIFAEGRVRDRLRALDLDVTAWESKVSKVMKVGRLDPVVQEAVTKLTIPVKEAGQVVDAWQDEDKRAAMLEILTVERRKSNELLDARLLFKAMLSAGRPEVVEPSWREADGGAHEYVTADGSVLATITIVDGRWSAEGGPMSAAQWQSLTKSMPRPPKP